MKERIREYFEEYAKVCQFRMLGTYEVFVLGDKIYADDTRDLFLKFEEICNNVDEDELDDFLNEWCV